MENEAARIKLEAKKKEEYQNKFDMKRRIKPNSTPLSTGVIPPTSNSVIPSSGQRVTKKIDNVNT